jgi:hypothetical protein
MAGYGGMPIIPGHLETVKGVFVRNCHSARCGANRLVAEPPIAKIKKPNDSVIHREPVQ